MPVQIVLCTCSFTAAAAISNKLQILNLNISTKRSYEIWGGPEGLAREIWDRKKAYEESERYRKGKLYYFTNG